PSATMRARDGATIVWETESTATGTLSIYQRTFNAKGRPLGRARQVNAGPVTPGSAPAVGGVVGNFVVVWSSTDARGDGAVRAQRYCASKDADGDGVCMTR